MNGTFQQQQQQSILVSSEEKEEDQTIRRTTSSNYTLHIPTTKKDFISLCELQDLAFEEKRGWCQPITDCRIAYQRAYEFYATNFPHKLQHCRIIIENDDDDEDDHDDENDDTIKNRKKVKVIGACQLQLPGDPGDMSFCADGMRRDVNEGDKHAYIEWIACHPEYTGQGIATALLEWAIEYCHEKNMHTLSLQVGSSNDRAIQLYQRHGFVTTTQPGDDCVDTLCLGPIYAFCCLGFKYYSLTYMERRLKDAPTIAAADEEGEEQIDDTNKSKDQTNQEGIFDDEKEDEKLPDNGMERE